MKKRNRILSYLMVLAMIFALMPANSYAKSIKLTNCTTTKVMPVGSTFLIQTNQKASEMKFTSSKNAVASVTKKGVIQAKTKGSAVIKLTSGTTVKKIKVTVKQPTGYTISKKAGSYTDSVQTKVTAKKGYNVYYTISDTFKTSDKIQPGKSKTFVFSSTKTLKIFPVKSSKKMTTAKLKKNQNTDKNRGDYLYTIVASEPDDTEEPEVTTAPVSTSTVVPTVVPTNTDTPIVSESPAPSSLPVNTPGGSEYQGDDSSSDYVKPVLAEYDELDKATEAGEEAVEITIPTVASGVKTTEATYEISKKNKLTILAAGTYVIHTESTETASDGLIEVDTSGIVHLILDGVNFTSSNNTAPDSDNGIINIKKSVERAVITIKENTVTTLDDTGENGIDKDDSVSTTYTGGITGKKIPLTINGSGTLNITSINGNGIKATGSLKILDTTISVSGLEGNPVAHNGITGKTGVFVSNANLDIHAAGDGLKATLDETDVASAKEDAEALVDEEAKALALAEAEALAKMGNMDIDGGTYKIVSSDGDAISVYRTLNLNPKEMDVTTKNLSETADNSSKGIKAGTTIYIPATAGKITVDTTATYNASRVKKDANDPYADDTIHSGGYIKIDGGKLDLSSGDDGIHSDKGLVINNGNITVKESYEALESADITINGGTISVKSRDDGINAGGGNDTSTIGENGMGGDNFGKGDSAKNTNFQIIINNGTITIDAEGDGIDSNGNIFFKGGIVTVNGPTNAGNGALDYGDGADCICEISGGTLIAAGAVGMDVAPTSGSTQPVVNVRLSSSQAGGTYVVLKDAEGNTVMTAQPTKKFQSVVMSCEALTLGSSYTVYYGASLDKLTQEATFTFNSVSVTTGTTGGGGWNPGGKK